MKKFITAFILISFLLGGVVSAQTVNQQTLNTQYQTLLRTLIDLLLKQVASLQAQLSQMQAAKIQTPVVNTNSNNATQQQNTQTIQISITKKLTTTSTAFIEWTTSRPSESKLYLSGGGLNSKLFASEAGYTTLHFVHINQLIPMTDYSFTITALSNDGFSDLSDGFRTETPAPTLDFSRPYTDFLYIGTQNYRIAWNSSYTANCSASGDWSGQKPTSGEEIMPEFTEGRDYIFTLSCNGNNDNVITKNKTVTVIIPIHSFKINGREVETYETNQGSQINLEWNIWDLGSPYFCKLNEEVGFGGTGEKHFIATSSMSLMLKCQSQTADVNKTIQLIVH